MRFFMRLISEGFIWAIGITQPRRGEEQRAARYITLLVVGVLVAALLFFLGLAHVF